MSEKNFQQHGPGNDFFNSASDVPELVEVIPGPKKFERSGRIVERGFATAARKEW